jgi:hypothetical protein
MAHIPRRYLAAPVLAASLARLALGAGSASAATVHAHTYGISYQAAAGETNNLNIHVDWWNTSGFYVDDLGAVIAVGGSCRLVDIHHAYCDGVLNRRIDIDAGDGDDTVHATSRAYVHGGPGNDSLHRDRDTCGAGADTLTADPLDIVNADCESVVR